MTKRNCVASVWIITLISIRLSGRRPAISQTKTSSLSLPTVSVAWNRRSSWFHVDIRKNLYANVLLSHRDMVVQLVSITTQSSYRLRNCAPRRKHRHYWRRTFLVARKCCSSQISPAQSTTLSTPSWNVTLTSAGFLYACVVSSG